MPTAASKFLILMNYSFIKLDSLGFFLFFVFSPETKQNKKKRTICLLFLLWFESTHSTNENQQ